MSKKDLDYIAALEKAIEKKYELFFNIDRAIEEEINK